MICWARLRALPRLETMGSLYIAAGDCMVFVSKSVSTFKSRNLESRRLHWSEVGLFCRVSAVEKQKSRLRPQRVCDMCSDTIVGYVALLCPAPIWWFLFFSSKIFSDPLVYVLNPWIDRERQGFPIKQVPASLSVALLLDSPVPSGSLSAFALAVLCLNSPPPSFLEWILCSLRKSISNHSSSDKISLATVSWKEP